LAYIGAVSGMSGNGDVTLYIPASVVIDLAGNENEASYDIAATVYYGTIIMFIIIHLGQHNHVLSFVWL
jgi:uncharacterized MAPEG superfamily protein